MSFRFFRNAGAFALGLSLGMSAYAAPQPSVRDAAQKGVNYLANSTAEWQRQNKCYGCHVQAVTMEGLSVGKANQYDVPKKDFQELIDGILNLPGGARSATGITHGSYPRTARTFGSAALARYDAMVDGKLSDDLLKHARLLLELQQKDGSVTGDHQSYPVTTGVMQATFQATQTWRQAYARSADDVWLAPLRKAEGYITKTAAAWKGDPKGVYLQDVNYALLGLVSAGVGKSEDSVAQLVKFVSSQQKQDGGWGFNAESDPFATGQSVYALRQAGLAETDPTVSKGLGWLVKHQQANGGWGAGGSGKAEAMWAVMGLVSTDVLTVAVKGIADGEHVGGVHEIVITADDNKGTGVAKVEVFIDDVLAGTIKGKQLVHVWKTGDLKTGRHTVDAVATNAKGQVSRRRLEVYAGDIYFSQLGTRFGDEGTQVNMRGIGPKDARGNLKLTVFSTAMKGGSASKDKSVFETTLPLTTGAMSFTWSGKDAKGKMQPAGRYFAQVEFIDAAGKQRQADQTLFSHEDPEETRKKYAEVAGKLDLARDGSGAANAMVDLVDGNGRIVQSVQSNEAGQYRFKSVDKGAYKVRVRKDGFKAEEAEVKAEPGAVAPASVSLH
jgi:Carboxypeptidase regulatory-like domain/Bacterial Ig domain/Prenyltransferase and squalene oxidase repeat